MTWKSVAETLRVCAEACIGCGDCTPRCEVLSEGLDPADGDRPGLTVGALAGAFADLIGDAETVSCDDGPDEAAAARIREFAQAHPDAVFTIRRCCMDAFCTLGCPTGIDARRAFATLRELLQLCGLIDMRDFTSTQVDREWHIFSVYRAVYGIRYEDLPKLDQAIDIGADTLFFPGCALGSYAPELTREVFEWLRGRGYGCVLSLECCGSPLRSGGLGDRADAFRRSLVETALENGIRRVVFVCPGCRDEWEAVEASEGLELVALSDLLAEAGCRIRSEKLAALGKGERPTLAPMDSCHDRDGRFGGPLRELLDGCVAAELPYHGSEAVCCGAAGSVSLVDPAICVRRVCRVLEEESAEVGADVVVANCPICAYTFAAHRRGNPAGPDDAAFCHYLDLLFESSFDWDGIFARLEGMWTGEYGAWVVQQLT